MDASSRSPLPSSPREFYHQTLPHDNMLCAPELGGLNSASQMNSCLGKVEPCDCETFCQSLQQNIEPDLELCSDTNPQADLQQNSGGSCHRTGQVEARDPVSARKVHKADREKLRRDRLNEQFLELAGALDPDRPKNDKATILGDTIQEMRELSTEVKRLRAERASLLDESRDLTQEKNELRDERQLLKNEVEQLQSQLQQRMRMSLSWMNMDPSVMMGVAAFPYPVPFAQSAPISAEPCQLTGQGQVQQPFVSPSPYIPLPVAPGALAVYPALQTYYRHGDGSNLFYPYPHYAPPVNPPAHVERPFAQYPNIMQPLPGYPLQIHPSQGRSSLPAYGQGASYYRPYTPNIPFISPQLQSQTLEKQQKTDSEVGGQDAHGRDVKSSGTEGISLSSSVSQPDQLAACQYSRQHNTCCESCQHVTCCDSCQHVTCHDSRQHVHTDLELQTLELCLPSAQSQQGSQASAKLDQIQHISEEERDLSSSQQPSMCASCLSSRESSIPTSGPTSDSNNGICVRHVEAMPDQQITESSTSMVQPSGPSSDKSKEKVGEQSQANSDQ
eukprot:c26727_g1_i1 orf=2268-3941(+)